MKTKMNVACTDLPASQRAAGLQPAEAAKTSQAGLEQAHAHEVTQPCQLQTGSTLNHRTANMRRAVDEHGLCTLTFDRANSSANTFDHAALLELDSHLGWIERAEGLRGVILVSGKPGIFIAGADLRMFADMAEQRAASVPLASPPNDYCPKESPARRWRHDDLADLIELGQRVFNRLSALCVPTVAAIHGACVGGGYDRQSQVALAHQHIFCLAAQRQSTKTGKKYYHSLSSCDLLSPHVAQFCCLSRC